MPAPIKGLEKLIDAIRTSSPENNYSVTFTVKTDGKIHDFSMKAIDVDQPKTLNFAPGVR